MRAKSEVLKGPKLLRVVGLEGPIFKDKYEGPEETVSFAYPQDRP